MSLIQKSWPAILVFMPVAFVAILLNQNNFAIGDDYHSLGFYFIMQKNNFFSAVSLYWDSPFAAGRPFAAVLEMLPLSMMDSINQLRWVRYLHIVIFGLIFGLFWEVVKKCNGTSTLAILVALFMFTLPGIWHMYMMNYGSTMLFAICVTLLGALLTAQDAQLSFKQWLFFALLTAFAIFSYQPGWPLLFAGLIGKMLSIVNPSNSDLTGKTNSASSGVDCSRKIQNYSINFIVAILIVLGVFICNFLLVKFGYDSPRLAANIEWLNQLHYIIYDLLPVTIYPWLYILFPDQLWLKVFSWLTFMVSFIIIGFSLIRTVYVIKGSYSKINLSEYIFILSIATSLIPITLGMYMFTDQAVAFRRVQFASMLFWFTFLFSMASVFRTTIITRYSKYLNYVFFIFITAYIFAFGYYLNVGTVQMASREWNAAVCASRISPLSEPARVNTEKAILPKVFPKVWSGDEFQVSTFSYPTGGMLVWLAHLEANKVWPAFSRWNVEFTSGPSLTDWDVAYSNCLNQSR